MTGSHWPTAEQELLLRAALRPGEAGLGAWREAAATLDLERLDPASRALLPQVYVNLARVTDLGAGGTALKKSYIATWYRNLRLHERARPLLEAFQRAGIDAIVLKGLALVARYYREPGARPMADVDILVPPSTIGAAGELARALGWTPWHRVTPAFMRVKHGVALDDGAGGVCDLHWRAFDEAGDAGADDEFRAAAVDVAFRRSRLRILSPTDQLLHVCGHAARWAPVPGIRWVADAVVILREGPIDWPRFVAQADRRRFLLRMREMLYYLRTAFGAGVPPAVLADLASRPVSMLEHLEYRIRSREHRVLGELPVYVFNCLRTERRPLLALPRYLQDAWGLDSLGEVPRHALARVIRRLWAARAGGHG